MYIDKNIIRFSYDFSTVNWENNSGKCKGTIYFDVFSDSGEILNLKVLKWIFLQHQVDSIEIILILDIENLCSKNYETIK